MSNLCSADFHVLPIRLQNVLNLSYDTYTEMQQWVSMIESCDR